MPAAKRETNLCEGKQKDYPKNVARIGSNCHIKFDLLYGSITYIANQSILNPFSLIILALKGIA